MSDASLIPWRFEITIVVNDDDHVMIDISAADGRFAGSTELYGGDRAIEELARGLRGFPRTPDDRRAFALGSADAHIADGYVEISCQCLDLAGHAVLQIHILDKSRGNGLDERRARVHLPVDVSAIDLFVERLTTWDQRPGSTVSLPRAI